MVKTSPERLAAIEAQSARRLRSPQRAMARLVGVETARPYKQATNPAARGTGAGRRLAKRRVAGGWRCRSCWNRPLPSCLSSSRALVPVLQCAMRRSWS
jgi:hypothetical protein